MAAKATPAQKAASKAFIKNLATLEKRSKLPRGEFCELLDLREGTYRGWLTKKPVLSEETRQAVRDAVEQQHARLGTLQDELFSFLAVTAPNPVA